MRGRATTHLLGTLSPSLRPSPPLRGRGSTACPPHDVRILVAARLLKPLGNPSPNSVKIFAAREVREQAHDRAWLAKVTNALNQHWQKKNTPNRQPVGNGRSLAPAIRLAGVGRAGNGTHHRPTSATKRPK